jgi:putative hemin transport protein
MSDAPDLAERRALLTAAEPRLYPRDIAARLGVTEADIVAIDEGQTATRLRRDFRAMLSEFHTLGHVLALTRNADAVHEKTGTFGPLEGGGHVALFVGEAMDLRLFLGTWRTAWAVEQNGRRSLQFFAGDGSAVHKVFATGETDAAAWDALIARYAAPDLPPFVARPARPAAAPHDDAGIDLAGLRAAWDAMRDTHEFHGLLSLFKVTRTQAFRLAGPRRARAVANGSVRDALQQAARTAMPIMVFVGNPGCIQIHSGPIETLREVGPWFNVLDPGFNLHLRDGAITETWVVAKPTADGVVTSVEAFDAAGTLIVSLFGVCKPGRPELPDWRALCAALPAR